MIPRYYGDGQTIGWKQGKADQEELEAVRRIICEGEEQGRGTL